LKPLELVIIVLFAALFVGIIIRIFGMLEAKRAGGPMARPRLVFFFMTCLMLVCLIPLALFKLSSAPVVISDLAVVAANFIGFVLTHDLRFRRASSEEEKSEGTTLRAYQVYYRGRPFGVIAREGFDVLMEHDLLKRQHNVELVEDFQTKSRQAGVEITLLRNREGTQTLIQVEGPPSSSKA
jgi:hypothetical protein